MPDSQASLGEFNQPIPDMGMNLGGNDGTIVE